MSEKILVGMRRVVKNGRGLAVTLPPQLRFLEGKTVIVSLEVFEPPKKNPEYVSEGVG